MLHEDGLSLSHEPVYSPLAYAWYLNWWLRTRGALTLRARPVIRSAYMDERTAIYDVRRHWSDGTIAYALLADIQGEHLMRNRGVDAALSYAGRPNERVTLFASIPIEYRSVTVEPWHRIAAYTYEEDTVCSYYDSCQNDSLRLDCRVAQAETVSSPEVKHHVFNWGARIGLALRDEQPKNWPWVFLPVNGQFIDVEMYYKNRYTEEFRQFYRENGPDQQVGVNYASLQKACLPWRWLTGVEAYVDVDASYRFDRYWSVLNSAVAVSHAVSFGKWVALSLYSLELEIGSVRFEEPGTSYGFLNVRDKALLPRVAFRRDFTTWGFSVAISRKWGDWARYDWDVSIWKRW